MQLGELNPVTSHTPSVSFRSSRHRVQFYNDEGYLLSSVSEHLTDSLVCDGLALAFTTAEHRQQIYERLALAGVPAEAIKKRCFLIEASEALSKFMRNGMPDRQLFFPAIKSFLQPQRANGSFHAGVAAFGEMVAVLLAEGKREAAIQLEQLWTEFTDSNATASQERFYQNWSP